MEIPSGRGLSVTPNTPLRQSPIANVAGIRQNASRRITLRQTGTPGSADRAHSDLPIKHRLRAAFSFSLQIGSTASLGALGQAPPRFGIRSNSPASAPEYLSETGTWAYLGTEERPAPPSMSNIYPLNSRGGAGGQPGEQAGAAGDTAEASSMTASSAFSPIEDVGGYACRGAW